MIEYEDFSVKIEPLRGDTYPVIVLRSPAGEGRSSLRLPFDPDSIGDLLSDLGRSVRGPEQSHTREASLGATRTPPQQIGDQLFNALFAGPARSLLDQSLGVIRERQHGLRIKLHIDPEDPSLARLASLPWELMYRKETRDFLNLSRYTPILRYLDVQRPYIPLPLQPPLRVLVVISSPWNYDSLDLDKERLQIQESWACQEGVAVHFIQTATITQISDRLAEHPYHVLHYMGHGAFDQNTGHGVLILEDEEEQGAPVDGTTLGILLRDVPSLRLVFLNACETARVTRQVGLDPFAGVAAAMVMAGIPAVVAMQFPITDQAAIRFANRFYPLLARGEPVDYAVAEGRRAIRLSESGTMEWATPVLFMRAPQGVIFEATTVPRGQPPLPELPDLPEEVDEELKKRLEQLYTTGLTAYYLGEWDKAWRSFQAIVDAQPNYEHGDAAAKLQEARRQSELEALYAQGQAAMEAEDWPEALAALDKLVAQQATYEDAAALLEQARKQSQLAELYAHARHLHSAAQWQAVLNVFTQIQAIDPSYADPEDLLPTAKQRAAEEQRLETLQRLYKQALRAMSAAQWSAAHELLVQIQDLEPNFGEAEGLLGKTEAELAREKAERLRLEKIAGLYEQAAGLAQTRQWQQVLDHMAEIHALDPDFGDPQELTARAQAEMERQTRRESLHQEAETAWQAQDWRRAILAFETLLAEEPGYRDASARLQAAQKQQELSDLYSQARQAHQAQQWQSVLDTLARLADLDPDYPDPGGLVVSAQTHLAEEQRQARLDDLYSRALRAIDADRWSEAHRLLTQVQETEPGFQDTEPLLAKTQAEIKHDEAERQRQEEISTLYEQALDLARAHQWREALAKLDEIRTLDPGFDDPDGIATKAQAQLTREEEEARRQQELATLYAEAVRLLKAGQYQEALEKWAEVRTLDPRYPDRKKVVAAASKKLIALERGLPAESRLALWIEYATEAPAKWGRATPTRSWVLMGAAVLTLLAILIAVLLLANPPRLLAEPILFTSNRDGNWEVYRLTTKGSERLTHTPAAESWSPAVGPSGSILLTSNRDGKQEVYRLTSGGLERLTHTPGAAKSWSPATGPADSILFTSDRDGKREVYRLGSAGLERLTYTPGDGESWSPALGPGGSILLVSDRDGKSEVYRLRREGLEQMTQTPGAGRSWSPALGPAGSILFTSDRDGKREVHSLTSQGLQRLTHSPGASESWCPRLGTGDAILFTSNRDGKEEIYRLSEGKTVRLTNTPGDDTSWLCDLETD